MSLLLDAQILLWWLSDDPLLPTAARDAITLPDNEVLVSAATAWEIAIRQAAGRLDAPGNLLEAVEANDFATLPITAAHALAAGTLPPYHSDPFDRLLIAQARAEGRTLISVDSRFPQYDVELLPLGLPPPCRVQVADIHVLSGFLAAHFGRSATQTARSRANRAHRQRNDVLAARSLGACARFASGRRRLGGISHPTAPEAHPPAARWRPGPDQAAGGTSSPDASATSATLMLRALSTTAWPGSRCEMTSGRASTPAARRISARQARSAEARPAGDPRGTVPSGRRCRPSGRLRRGRGHHRCADRPAGGSPPPTATGAAPEGRPLSDQRGLSTVQPADSCPLSPKASGKSGTTPNTPP
ncbi:MAG: type II toxin-antitoxin system VapC family toxin [Acidimicrobiales bacterium]